MTSKRHGCCNYVQHDKYIRPSHSARSVAESRNPFTDERIKRYGSCNYVQDDKEKKTWMLQLSRSITLVAIITFHSSSHSVVSRSEIAESRKGVAAATTRSMTLVAIIAFHISILNEMTKRIGLMFSCIPRQIVCE